MSVFRFLSEKLISVVGQMSVSDKCPRITREAKASVLKVRRPFHRCGTRVYNSGYELLFLEQSMYNYTAIALTIQTKAYYLFAIS